MPPNERAIINNCPFCRAGQSFLVSPNFKAFYNIAPILPGHSLVAPIRHCESIYDLSDEELSEMVLFTRKATRILQKAFRCDGFDWTLQNGKCAGQTVNHLHLHIIPRKSNDLPKEKNWFELLYENAKSVDNSDLRIRMSENEYQSITELLKKIAMQERL